MNAESPEESVQHPKGSWCAECEPLTSLCGSFMTGWLSVVHKSDCQWAVHFAPTGEHLVFVGRQEGEFLK